MSTSTRHQRQLEERRKRLLICLEVGIVAGLVAVLLLALLAPRSDATGLQLRQGHLSHSATVLRHLAVLHPA